MNIALQLYSIRELAKEGLEKTMFEAAKAGYDGVEFAGYGGKSAAEVKELLKKYSLKAAGTHIGYGEVLKDAKGIIEFCKEIGTYSAVVPHAAFNTTAEWVEFAKKMDEFGKMFKEAGIVFGYHNHAHEFVKFDGKYAMDIILENSSPENVIFEMDTHWVCRGNEIPEQYAAKYTGRLPIFHAKDIDVNDTDTEVGTGRVNFPAVVKAIGKVDWIVVEQEAFQMDMLESIKISCANLNKMFR
jgi:Sugar phosphate isomerases/epimerases